MKKRLFTLFRMTLDDEPWAVRGWGSGLKGFPYLKSVAYIPQ